MEPTTIPAGSVRLGYLIESRHGLRAGRATIKAGDVLRCIACEENARTFVNRRTRAVYTLALADLPANFRSIGFDGYEDIILEMPTLRHICTEAHDGNEPLGVCETCGAERPFPNDPAL